MKTLLLIVATLFTLNANACIDHDAKIYTCIETPLSHSVDYDNLTDKDLDICEEELNTLATEHGITSHVECMDSFVPETDERYAGSARPWIYHYQRCFYKVLLEMEELGIEI